MALIIEATGATGAACGGGRTGSAGGDGSLGGVGVLGRRFAFLHL